MEKNIKVVNDLDKIREKVNEYNKIGKAMVNEIKKRDGEEVSREENIKSAMQYAYGNAHIEMSEELGALIDKIENKSVDVEKDEDKKKKSGIENVDYTFEVTLPNKNKYTINVNGKDEAFLNVVGDVDKYLVDTEDFFIKRLDEKNRKKMIEIMEKFIVIISGYLNASKVDMLINGVDFDDALNDFEKIMRSVGKNFRNVVKEECGKYTLLEYMATVKKTGEDPFGVYLTMKNKD